MLWTLNDELSIIDHTRLGIDHTHISSMIQKRYIKRTNLFAGNKTRMHKQNLFLMETYIFEHFDVTFCKE